MFSSLTRGLPISRWTLAERGTRLPPYSDDENRRVMLMTPPWALMFVNGLWPPPRTSPESIHLPARECYPAFRPTKAPVHSRLTAVFAARSENLFGTSDTADQLLQRTSMCEHARSNVVFSE